MKVERTHKHTAHYQKLQEFIQKHNLLFNSPAWLANYPAHQVCQCVILNNNSDVIGCFTYFEFKKSIFKFVIPPPFSPDIALFYINPAESVVSKHGFDKEIAQHLADYFDNIASAYKDLTLPQDFIDTQPFIWNGYISKSRYSYLLDLTKSQEALWDGLASEKRKSINKAVKDQLSVEASFDRELLYGLVIKSLARNDLDKNTAIIRNILFNFAGPENSFAYVAFHNGQAVGATFCLYTKEKAVYLFGGFSSENKHHGAGVSCMWQSILKAKALGLKHFDFEGSMNPAIERYFREFGGTLTPYFHVQKIKPLLGLLLKLKNYK